MKHRLVLTIRLPRMRAGLGALRVPYQAFRCVASIHPATLSRID